MTEPIASAAAPISRREFTLQSALALLAGVAITVEGCGSKSTPTAPSPVVNDLTGSVSANHGHTATVTAAQITAANAISLNIQGSAAHPHTVEVSQADLRTLQNRQPVTKDSTNNNNHTHSVTFTPA
ncbi:MAG: hypothetical protein ACRD3C_27125 [Vicinamibacterales bacterium]